jgi:hypothetical protein
MAIMLVSDAEKNPEQIRMISRAVNSVPNEKSSKANSLYECDSWSIW